MEPGELHEPTNTVPAYSPELDAALDRISRQDCSKLKGTEFDIVTRRLKRDGDMRYPLRSDELMVGIGGTTFYVPD
jgi:hypothetical protein